LLVVTATVGAAKAAAGTVARQAEHSILPENTQSATRPPVPGRPLRVHASQNYPSAAAAAAAQTPLSKPRGADGCVRGNVLILLGFFLVYIYDCRRIPRYPFTPKKPNASTISRL